MRFDLVDLRLFVNVVEAGSITHGAERLHLAIAAASTRTATWRPTSAFRSCTASGSG
jgi:DNA-binding transcriptional LysR family regulator